VAHHEKTPWYFILPDGSASARRIRDELLLAQIEDGHIHVLGQGRCAIERIEKASIPANPLILYTAQKPGLAVVVEHPRRAGKRAVHRLESICNSSPFCSPHWSVRHLAHGCQHGRQFIPNSATETLNRPLSAGRVLMMSMCLPDVSTNQAVIASHTPKQQARASSNIPAFP